MPFLQVRIAEELDERLRKHAGANGVTVSEVVRMLIESGLEVPNVVASLEAPKRKKPALRVLADVFKNGNSEFTVGEMYSGPGGLGLGAELAQVKLEGRPFRFNHSWATDYDPDTCQTFAANLGKGNFPVICSDIREVDIRSLPYADGFLYGFPCNDFSLVGESKGLDGSFGPLYQYGVEYISQNNPLFILAENVSGLSSANDGGAFVQILSDLETAGRFGYELTVHLYKFEDYGVPQARHRIIIVGIRKDLGKRFEVPAPPMKMKTAREAIESPPISPDAANHELTKQHPRVVERLQHIRPGENAWTADLPVRLQLNVKGAKLSQIYKRLDPSKPAYTITGSGGGGTHVYHWVEDRALTNRERARLQTFPDNFRFVGSKESVRKQIGMAVPPAGAKIILEAVLKTLLGVKYKSIEPSFR